MNSLYNATAKNCTNVGNGTACGGVSNPLPPWYYSSFNVTLVALYSLIIVAALIGNLLVCLAVCINANLRQNVSSYFIVSLAISDIGTTCFSMTFDLEQFTTHGKWYHGETLCVIWTTAYLITVPSSIWNLFILSIDRYKTLRNPWKRYKESRSMTTKRAVVTIAILWIYCLVFALLPVMGWKAYPVSVKNNYCWFNISVVFSIAGSVFNFYLPMFAMCYIYYKVYLIARTHTKFPLALKTRYETGSGNTSGSGNTGSGNGSGVTTLNALEPGLGRTSIKQNQNGDPTNQDTTSREVVGLENVSFCLEENLERKSIRPEEHSTDKEHESAHENLEAVGLNPLGTSDIDKAVLSNKPRITTRCVNTRTDHSVSTRDDDVLRKNRYGLKSCDSTDNDIQFRETKIRAENSFNKDDLSDEKSPKDKTAGFSSELTSPLSAQKNEMRDSIGNECATKEKNFEGEAIPNSAAREVLHSRNMDNEMENDVEEGLNESNMEKRERIGQQSFPEKAQLKTSISLSGFKIKRIYSPSRLENKCIKNMPSTTCSFSGTSSIRKTKFPFGKSLKTKGEAMDEDEACSLRKFHKRSIENPEESIEGQRESSSDSKCLPPGELKEQRDSLTHSNQKRLKHLTRNTKAARTISIIVGAFLICWMPFTTMSIAFNICSVPCYTLIPQQLFQILLCLGYLNSALNPVLFSYRNMQFRKSYRQIASAALPCLKK